MRPIFFSILFFSILFGTLFVSCATEETPNTVPATTIEEPEPGVTVPAEPEPEPIHEPEPVQVEEEVPEEPLVEEEAVPEDDFVVTEDMYEQTFTDVETLIAELNAIIRDENYEAWTTYLTKIYKSSLEDPEELSRISEEPILKKYNIRLETLRDYFFYVVVPSRSDASLDDIVFVNESQVKAIMIINNRRSILYKLEKIDDKWKIGDF